MNERFNLKRSVSSDNKPLSVSIQVITWFWSHCSSLLSSCLWFSEQFPKHFVLEVCKHQRNRANYLQSVSTCWNTILLMDKNKNKKRKGREETKKLKLRSIPWMFQAFFRLSLINRITNVKGLLFKLILKTFRIEKNTYSYETSQSFRIGLK